MIGQIIAKLKDQAKNQTQLQQLCNDDFLKKHVYDPSQNSSFKNHGQGVAKNRRFPGNDGLKISSMIRVENSKDLQKELEYAINAFNPEDFVVDNIKPEKTAEKNIQNAQIRRGVFFDSQSNYRIVSSEVNAIQRGKGNQLQSSEGNAAKLKFAVQIIDGKVKIVHFHKVNN